MDKEEEAMAITYVAPPRQLLSSRRTFSWYRPAGKSPTEYEDLTCGQQSDPAHYAYQGWPVRFDDGRDPVYAGSTKLRSVDWFAFRDPNRMMNRTYVASTNEAEKSLSRSIAGAVKAGHFAFANPGWVRVGLGQHFMTYPFVNYGLFLAFSYAEREALSDTVTFAIVFTAVDKLRHMQDAVHYSFDLAEAFGDASDAEAPVWWKTAQVWQGARAAVEHIIASTDWMEIVVAANLSFDRVFGDLAKVEYFGRFAAANGDSITPMLIASAQADDHRTMAWTRALVQHLVSDAMHGAANRTQINEWIDKWDAHSKTAIDAFAPCFTSAPTRPVSFTDAAASVWRRRNQLLAELGLTPSNISVQGGGHV
jgi:methane monooxygenase component A beta chain/propane monooxygenase small subunit